LRWLVFIPLAVLALIAQISVGAVLRVGVGATGLSLSVDFLAIVAVLVTLRVRMATDAMLAGWVLGLLIDLSSVCEPIGLYACCFAIAAWAIFQVRSAVFADNPLSQALTTLAFCLLGHVPARLFVNLYVRATAVMLWREMIQVLLLAVCTAVFAPLLLRLLRRLNRQIVAQRNQGR